jgi:pilus assembly protein CpaB
MRPKSIILLVLALGCGLVASIGINRVMANRNAPVLVTGETQPICVAVKDINMNDPVQPAEVKLEDWPVDKIPLGAISKIEDLEGRRTKNKLYAGEPILEAKLWQKGESGASAIESIPTGMRVVAVRVDDVQTSGSLILPGDRVDMMVHLTQNSAKDLQNTTTKTFLQNVKVFAVNDVTERQPGGAENKIVARTVSVLVTPEQAELVTMASELGRIRLVLRGPNDDNVEPTAGVLPGALLGSMDQGLAQSAAPAATNPLAALIPQPATAAAVPAVEPETRPSFTMTIIKGAEAQDYELDTESRGSRAAKITESADETLDNTPADEPDEPATDGPDAADAAEPAADEGQEQTADEEHNDTAALMGAVRA